MEELEDEKAFKLNAKAILEFNETIESSLTSNIGFADEQRIREFPYVRQLFDIFNELQAKQFKFEETNAFIENKGQKPEAAEASAEATAALIRTEKVKKVAAKKVDSDITCFDIVKPCISENGEFLGV